MDPLVLSVLYVWCQLNKDVIVSFWFGTQFKVCTTSIKRYYTCHLKENVHLLAFKVVADEGGVCLSKPSPSALSNIPLPLCEQCRPMSILGDIVLTFFLR